MASVQHVPLNARKAPRQKRATATVEAILEASLQVLVGMGPTRLTTTLVAARAGVSVGTMYQYFPNKQALLYAVSKRELARMAGRLEDACRAQHGAPVAVMAEALVDAYWDARTGTCAIARALYLAAAEVDTADLVANFSRRVETATAAMFASAADAAFADITVVNHTLLTSLSGTVRSLFDRDLPKPWICGVRQQLIFMCCSYLEAARTPAATLAVRQ
jgi:AcrR family transcriptional regulator